MTAPAADPVMERITAAVTAWRGADPDAARADLLDLWRHLGAAGDALHRVTLAHYLADMVEEPAVALIWDVRALDAAAALTDARAQRHHPSLTVAEFLPSLHLNLADNLRRLGAWDAARSEIDAARANLDALDDDAYGTLIRTAIDEVGAAIDDRSREKRATAPG